MVALEELANMLLHVHGSIVPVEAAEYPPPVPSWSDRVSAKLESVS